MREAASGDHGAGSKLAIWLVDLEAAAEPLAAIDAGRALIPSAERATLHEASAAAGAADRLTARRALRLLIEHTFGPHWRAVPFTATARGRPTLDGLGGTFNLSHAGGKALIVLGTMESAGADVERTRPVHITGERRIALQAAAIDAAGGSPLPPDDGARALQAWVRLEALAKADGGGIGSLLAAFGIWGASRPSRAHTAEEGTRPTAVAKAAQARPDALLERYVVHDIAAGVGLHAAVALPRGIAPPALSVFPDIEADLERLRAGA